jgi:hypothetical protein
MKSIHLTVAITIATHLLVSSNAQAATLTDGDFSSWSFNANGTATVLREATGGNPGARLNFTTNSGPLVYGTAIKSDFVTNTPFEGDAFSLSLDVLGGFGLGQFMDILVEQSGNIYSYNRGVTFARPNFTTLTFNGIFNQSNFQRLIGSGASRPDFTSGVATRFGFAGGNNNSGTLTQYYDNFKLDSNAVATAVPEPTSTLGLICGAFSLYSLRRRIRKTRNGDTFIE